MITATLDFRKFLMTEEVGGLTTDDQDALQTIIDHVVSGDEEFFNNNSITVKVKPPYWILNYIQGAPTNKYSLLTRGLVINQYTGQVVSMPFKRFGNFGEDLGGYKSVVDIAKSEILEKLDGSMLGVAFPDGDPSRPIWHTRKMISSHEPDMNFRGRDFAGNEHALLQQAGQYVKQLLFESKDVDKTFIFELINSERPVITKYTPSQLGLYLIGVRSLKTWKEYTEDELDNTAKRIGARRPRRWGVKGNQAEIKAMMDQFADDFEGFVLRQSDTGDRAKLKKKEYMERHKLIGKTNYRNLIPLWLQGETSEIVTYLPETGKKFAIIDRAFQQKVQEMTQMVRYYNVMTTKKDLAQIMVLEKVPNLIQGFVFAAFGQPDTQIPQMVAEKIKALPIDTLMELLELNDNEVS
jgi:hypothetical protein